MDLNNNDNPSMNNIYDSTYLNQVIDNEQKLSNNLYNQALNPFKSGVVSHYDTASSLNKVHSLSGEVYNARDFKHNNMTPFIKGGITQNTNVDGDNFKLQVNTGYNNLGVSKKEITNFFKPEENKCNIYTKNVNNDAFYKDRIVDSTKHNNTSPIESMRVGPGLNKGFSNCGDGGFQQPDSILYAMPKSIDELRSKINQKNSTFQIPFQAPAKGIVEQRGMVKDFSKNRPETVYENKASNLIKSKNHNEFKENDRPIENLKSCMRNTSHPEYSGNVNITDYRYSYNDDKNRTNITIYDNERNLTETRTVISNLTSVIKSMIAPILDIPKLSIKEYTVDSTRSNGNARTQIPEKATLYDKENHIMKKTIKETALYESEQTNLTGADETYTSLYDLPKITIKETTIHDDNVGNIKITDGTYEELKDKPKITTKETIGPVDNTRNIGNIIYKVYEYDPKIVAKKTVKQTTIKQDNTGFFSSIIKNLSYLLQNNKMKNTNKQYTSDYENYGTAQSKNTFFQTDRKLYDNAEIDGTREKILMEAGYTPGAGGKFIGVPKENINVENKKQIDMEIADRNYGNINKIYQIIPDTIDTNTKNVFNANAYENRLDPSLLSSLKNNEFSISINNK